MTQIDPQTETACANAALSACKISPILSMDADSSEKAKACRMHFASTRDALQRVYKWNFNEAYLALPEGGDDIPSGFAFCHRFPFTPDMLGVREVVGCAKDDWKVQGRSIIANQSGPLKVVASLRVPTVSTWDALFKLVFIASLAAAIAPQVCKDEDTIKRVNIQADQALEQAEPVDAGEGVPDQPEPQAVIAERFF